MTIARMKITLESLFLLWTIEIKAGRTSAAKKYASAHDELKRKINELESQETQERAA